MIKLLLICLFVLIKPVFAQTTVQIGATFSTAPRFIQCVDYVCRDDTGQIVGTLEQVSPEELNEVEPAAGEDFETEEELKDE